MSVQTDLMQAVMQKIADEVCVPMGLPAPRMVLDDPAPSPIPRPTPAQLSSFGDFIEGDEP